MALDKAQRTVNHTSNQEQSISHARHTCHHGRQLVRVGLGNQNQDRVDQVYEVRDELQLLRDLCTFVGRKHARHNLHNGGNGERRRARNLKEEAIETETRGRFDHRRWALVLWSVVRTHLTRRIKEVARGCENLKANERRVARWIKDGLGGASRVHFRTASVVVRVGCRESPRRQQNVENASGQEEDVGAPLRDSLRVEVDLGDYFVLVECEETLRLGSKEASVIGEDNRAVKASVMVLGHILFAQSLRLVSLEE